MPAGRPDTRQRMIASAAALLGERGARATSLDDVLRDSGAPRGSVYHHFPGGREELLLAATAHAGDELVQRLATAAPEPEAAIDALVSFYLERLQASDLRAGSALVAVAIEAREDGDRTIQEEAASGFARAREVLAERLLAGGLPAEQAEPLAVLALAAVEGAVVLSRAAQSLEPLETVRAQLLGALRAAA